MELRHPLDLTGNPLAALYFACCGDGDSKMDGEVVFFRIPKADVKYFDSDTVSVIANLSRRPTSFELPPEGLTLEEFNSDREIGYLLHEIKKEKPYFEPLIRRDHLRSVVFVKPRLDNPRIIRQDGAFLLFGMNRTKTECAELPTDIQYWPKEQRVLVAARKKPRILKQLDALGISQATLFPEIDHVSGHIKAAYARQHTEDDR